jgi:MFS family permease
MFSLVSRPSALPTEASLEPFDEETAALATRNFLAAAPERAPGSDGDDAAAAFVRSEFESLAGGTVTSERFEAGDNRRSYELENVIYTLTGETDDLIVVTAPRDCQDGPCAASSGAATGALIELARIMSNTHHRKTVLFVSTDGSTIGAAGAKSLARYLKGRSVTGLIVLSQPGAMEPRGRHVVPWSSSTRATSSQLVQSAEAAIETELVGEKAPLRGSASELVRLAVPAGLGEQAPLIASGIDAIALAGAGELRLPAAEDEDFSTETLGMVGRAALSLVRSLDEAPPELAAGPRSRIPLSGKLVPGWALGLLSMALLIPLAASALESFAWVKRRGYALLPSALWLVGRVAPFFVAVVLAYLLSLVRLVPAPVFPFEAATYPFDWRAALTMFLLAATIVGTQIVIERRIPAPTMPESTRALLSLAIFIAGLVTWLVNPFLALILIPALHLILLASGSFGPRALKYALLLAALLVPVLIVDALGRQLGASFAESLWQILLMFTGGHFGFFTSLPGVLFAGCLAATLQVVVFGWTNMRNEGLRVQASRRRYSRAHQN